MMVQWFKNLAQNIGSDEIISTKGALGEGLPKKVAVLLDFVQMRGGRTLPKILGTLALRKSGISCPNFGVGESR